ncbi:MAG: hypothetical protein AAB597_02445 [Patescibacteria group bacterium]
MYRMTANKRKSILSGARNAVSKVIEKLGMSEEGKGGYFRLFHLENPKEGYIGLNLVCEGWVGGHSNAPKMRKYWIVSMEKAIRLATKAALYGDSASGQSKDESKDHYAGAILVRCIPDEDSDPVWLIFSFSGLPAQADEAVTIATSAHMAVNVDEVRKLVELTQNELAWDLVHEMYPHMDIGPRPAKLL